MKTFSAGQESTWDLTVAGTFLGSAAADGER